MLCPINSYTTASKETMTLQYGKKQRRGERWGLGFLKSASAKSTLSLTKCSVSGIILYPYWGEWGQNPDRMAKRERDLLKSSCPSPELKQGHHVQMEFEHLHWWKFHSLSGQLCISAAQVDVSMLHFTVLSCKLHYVCTDCNGMSRIYISWDSIPYFVFFHSKSAAIFEIANSALIQLQVHIACGDMSSQAKIESWAWAEKVVPLNLLKVRPNLQDSMLPYNSSSCLVVVSHWARLNI